MSGRASPGTERTPAVRERRVSLEAKRSWAFEARRGRPGRAPKRAKQTLNPKHGRDGRRDFSSRRAGKRSRGESRGEKRTTPLLHRSSHARGHGRARGEGESSSRHLGLRAMREWPTAESRRGKSARRGFLFLSQFLRARFFLRLSAHIRDWHFRFLETIYLQKVKHFYRSSRDRFFQVIQTFAKWRRYRGDVCRAGRFVDFASRGGGAFPAQRSQRDGDAREVSVFVRRRGRVSDARR